MNRPDQLGSNLQRARDGCQGSVPEEVGLLSARLGSRWSSHRPMRVGTVIVMEFHLG